jgi:hypothetical protein
MIKEMIKNPKGFMNSQSGKLICDMFGCFWKYLGKGWVLFFREIILVTLGISKGYFVL